MKKNVLHDPTRPRAVKKIETAAFTRALTSTGYLLSNGAPAPGMTLAKDAQNSRFRSVLSSSRVIPLSEFTEPALWSIYCGDRNNLLSLRTETDFQSFSRAGASTNLRCSTTDCPAEKLSMMYGKTNRE